MKTPLLLTVVVTTLTAACSIGRWSQPALSGMAIRVNSPSGQLRIGELLAAPDSGVVFLDHAHMVFVPYLAGIEMSFATPSGPGVFIKGRPDSGDLSFLRFHSRYPLGLDDATIAGILSRLDQSEVEVWR